jgi:glucokinase
MEGLVGDIGGTNARFALAVWEGGRPVVREALTLANKDYASAEAAIEAYLGRVKVARRPERVVLAVAGPVTEGRARLTNLDWEFSEERLRAHAGFHAARLINDFAAQALGAVRLPPDGLVRLGPAVEGERHAPVAIMGPGTGFGAAALLRERGRDIVLSTEGGHIAFAPTDAMELKLLERLIARFGRVSIERILSGPGLYNLYEAMAEVSGQPAACKDQREVDAAADAGDPLARQTLERFVLILGAAAGDLALATGARGGVYITGGVAEKLVDHIVAGGFRERFEAKGRFQAYMRAIPTWLVTDGYTGLIGAAAALDQMEPA